ncbi:single-stranded DNA-binding protein [Spiroplasma endosymbiont of Labia minor]|uniref:single-stranded DNA-binding protein n=1 Tax=Spiroplasma endosymbiont of Labia minor TaxID=3066305 RepID=UPI0030CB30A4
MNHVSIIGQIDGQPTLVYESPNGGEKKLYRITLKTEKFNPKSPDRNGFDFINVKIWNSLIQDVETFQDGVIVALEGRIQSFGDGQHNQMLNEVLANRFNYLY